MNLEIEYSLREIDTVAEKIIENANSKILLFYGDLGAGKTTLIKSLVRKLGSDNVVTSPTFSLVNEYEGNEKMYHFDFYRINDEEEAYDIGFEEYLDSQKWCFIEWPEKIKFLLAGSAIMIKIKKTHQNKRFIAINSIIL